MPAHTRVLYTHVLIEVALGIVYRVKDEGLASILVWKYNEKYRKEWNE